MSNKNFPLSTGTSKGELMKNIYEQFTPIIEKKLAPNKNWDFEIEKIINLK